YYGNNDAGADAMIVRVMDDYMDAVRTVKERCGVLRPAGISTFGRQIDWKDSRFAGAHGYKRGEILASNLSPTPGKDVSGATSVIASHCKIHLSKLACGTALDIKLDPSAVRGEDGENAVMGLLRAFVALGGHFMQIDVMDNAVLLEAQKHPENYQNLSVRISGWSARFVTLDDNWQRMIIERT
ncbi:MAG: glycine radical domain-containing protein, partial [Eubacteriales bacterium]